MAGAVGPLGLHFIYICLPNIHPYTFLVRNAHDMIIIVNLFLVPVCNHTKASSMKVLLLKTQKKDDPYMKVPE